MKVVAAYLLAVLGGNTSPGLDDVKCILNSGSFTNSLFFSYRFNCYIGIVAAVEDRVVVIGFDNDWVLIDPKFCYTGSLFMI